jgi:hypothetical protein
MHRHLSRSLAVLGLAIALPLATAIPASASAPGWSAPVTLSASGLDAFDPQIVSDGTTITAIWARFDGSVSIQAAFSIDGGATWSAPVDVSASGQFAQAPKIVTDGARITAVWTESNGSNDEVLSASSTDGGASWSTPVSLSDGSQNAFFPQIVTDGTTITAIWNWFDGSNEVVQSASSTDGGATWSAPVTLSDPGESTGNPQVTTDGTTITALWNRFDGSNDRIQAANSTDGGATWSTPVTLSDAGGSAFGASAVISSTAIVATWTRSDGTNYRIQSASSTDGGATWTTPVTVSEPGQDAFTQQMVTDGTIITVLWKQSDGVSNRIRSAFSTDGGSTWSSPVNLSAAGGDAGAPQVVSDGTTTTAAWVRFDGSDDRVQLASSSDGGVTWETAVTVSDAGGGASGPQLTSAGSVVTAIWSRFDGTVTRVQASSAAVAAPSALAATGMIETVAPALAAVLLLGGLGLLAVRPRRSHAR